MEVEAELHVPNCVGSTVMPDCGTALPDSESRLRTCRRARRCADNHAMSSYIKRHKRRTTTYSLFEGPFAFSGALVDWEHFNNLNISKASFANFVTVRERLQPRLF
jgi:hypothetical protein